MSVAGENGGTCSNDDRLRRNAAGGVGIAVA